jgi:hypothetical protein
MSNARDDRRQVWNVDIQKLLLVNSIDKTAQYGYRVDVLDYVRLGWVGLSWVGLGYVGLGWVRLGWVRLGWVTLD